jgi:hypothetical protein
VAYGPKYVSFFTLRNPAMTPSPSVTTKWGPPVSSIFHLMPSNNNNNAYLEQLLTTQTQLMQVMLQTLTSMQPNQQ